MAGIGYGKVAERRVGHFARVPIKDPGIAYKAKRRVGMNSPLC